MVQRLSHHLLQLVDGSGQGFSVAGKVVEFVGVADQDLHRLDQVGSVALELLVVRVGG